MYLNIVDTVPLLALALLSPVVPAAASAETAAGFSVLTPATSVASRTDRRPMAGGVYDPAADTTFISWSGQAADSYVQGYHHGRRTWSEPRKVAGGESDPHNYPTLVLAADGHRLVFRGMHNSRTVVSRAPLAHSLDCTWTETARPPTSAR
ncbi:BNR-4 repeat-containing protein [Amycolatopsis nigrescens]|uniref:BNR-4 repeat-containing protein n=1 Tax=Amycolatopsis nigrescens TaxID=381445 RepID=UPI00036CDA4A|nr:BNR-4 repeat-containing protein [Amycolatopsis nigrescens]